MRNRTTSTSPAIPTRNFNRRKPIPRQVDGASRCPSIVAHTPSVDGSVSVARSRSTDSSAFASQRSNRARSRLPTTVTIKMPMPITSIESAVQNANPTVSSMR